LIIGCGDDESSGNAEDGGVSQDDLMDIENQITMIGSDLGELTDNVGELGEEVTSIGNDLDTLTTEAERRLDALEDPTVLNCSEFEVCVPDGIGMVSGDGDDNKLAAIIDVVCEHEIDCCDETELNLKFGPGIESKADCISLFNDVVENGFSPDFFESYLTPSVVYQVIGVAQALNDPRVRVEIDEAGVEECVESLEAECPEIAEPGEPGDPECVAPVPYEEDPCSLDNLLNGLQEEGELCGDYSFGEGEDIPECEEGFYCSFDSYTNGDQGICAKLPEEGDFCQTDPDCDPYGSYYYAYGANVTNLYCNLQTAHCEPLGDVGDPCTFIDEDFAIYDSNNLSPATRSATSQDCLPNLTCDPSSNTCVALCSEGRFCAPGSDPFFTCGENLLCNVTEVPELFETWGMGTCAPAIEEGDTCTEAFECETGKCADDCDPDTSLCSCSVMNEPGEDCDTPGFDETCSSNWCDTASECAALCNCDDDAYDGDCDANVGEGPAVMAACGDGHYCDFGNYNGINDPQGYAQYSCEPKIANGVACDVNTNVHASCASGFCDPGTSLCAPKVAVDAACPSTLDEQCRTNQYCNASNICRTYLAAGANCDLADVTLLECAKGLVCVDAGTDTCQALAESGEACNDADIAEPSCNDIDDPTLTCVDIDGTASGLVLECYSYMGGYADGVDCAFSDSYCASGWCRPNAVLSPTASSCTQPLEEGDDCDTLDQTQDVCGEGLYCNHPQNETAGKCAPQHGPGGSCKPYFSGNDCRYNGSCIFTKDQYLCDSASIDYATEIFCGSD
jgi:hypothetical protein